MKAEARIVSIWAVWVESCANEIHETLQVLNKLIAPRE